METIKLIATNIIVANLLKEGVLYYVRHTEEDLVESSLGSVDDYKEAANLRPKIEPSWLLPYIFALQISSLYLFFYTLKEHELPTGRIRKTLIILKCMDLLYNLMDVLQYAIYANYGVDVYGYVSNGHYGTVSYIMDVIQHLDTGIYIFLCADVSNIIPFALKSFSGLCLISGLFFNAILTPLSFDQPDSIESALSFTEYRNMALDASLPQRLSSLQILPCIALTIIFIHQRMRKKWQNMTAEKVPTEKGDERVTVLDVKKFTYRSMICHYIISTLYCFMTLGIQMNNNGVIELIRQFDSPENSMRKFGYLQQVTNSMCLLSCLNVEDELYDSPMGEETELEFHPTNSEFPTALENELD